MIDNFRYEDVETLAPVERPCLTAWFLQSDLVFLRSCAEHKSVSAENIAATLVEIVDCLERLFASLKNESTRLALQNVHAPEGRKVRFAEGWYGSYCEAARAAGRMYYRAIYAAADPDEYAEWILADSPNSRVPRPLPAAIIKSRWAEIAQAVFKLPELDFNELVLGIRNEWIEVRGTNPPDPVVGTVNQRMAEMLLRDPNLIHWTRRKWKICLDCSESAVQESDTWKITIRRLRLAEKLSREESRDRHPK